MKSSILSQDWHEIVKIGLKQSNMQTMRIQRLDVIILAKLKLSSLAPFSA